MPEDKNTRILSKNNIASIEEELDTLARFCYLIYEKKKASLDKNG